MDQPYRKVQQPWCILELVKNYPNNPKSRVPFLYLRPYRPDQIVRMIHGTSLILTFNVGLSSAPVTSGLVCGTLWSTSIFPVSAVADIRDISESVDEDATEIGTSVIIDSGTC